MNVSDILIKTDPGSEKIPGLLISELIDQGKIGHKVGKSLLDFWSSYLSQSEIETTENFLDNFLFRTTVTNCIWGIYLIELPTRSMVYKFSPDEDPLLIKVLDAAQPDENVEKKSDDFHRKSQSSESETFRLHTQDLQYNNKKYMLAVVSLVTKADLKVLERVKNIFSNYYLLTTPPKNVHLINYFSLTSKDIIQEISNYQKDQPVTFIYFLFEPLKKYVKYGGDHFAQEVVNYIKSKLYESFSDDVICYALTLRKYLLVCPDIDNELLSTKLKKINFHLKQIILTYKVNYFTANHPIENLESVWEKLNT